jgi:hypothetical protein
MAPKSWPDLLPLDEANPLLSGQVGPCNAIIASTAFRQAVSSDCSSCCVARFRGVRWVDLDERCVRVPNRAYSSYLRCPSHQFCESGRIAIPPGLVEGPFRKPKLPGFTIPRLIPLVNPCDKRTFAHHYLQDRFSMVAVQLWKLMRSGPAYRLAHSKGLNRMLNFDGKILISSVMPDSYILHRGVSWFINAIKELKPDIVTTWDVPTYSDHPKKASLSWLLTSLEAARRMSLELDTPLIGLVAGADLPQVELSSTCLRAMGFHHQALACHELLVGRQQEYLKSCASIVARNCSDLTMLSCSHPNMIEKFRMADHFVGMSWFNQAVRGRRLRSRSDRSLDRGRDRTAQLIRDNLIETVNSFRESFPNDTPGGG